MSTLVKAIEIALQAHRDQTDKGGVPLVLHPLRVMMKMDTDEERIAAVLHDVVEDSYWTLEDLRKVCFSEAILELIDLLSRRKGESYEHFIDRIKVNPTAIKIKLADLEDNMDPKRLPGLTPKDVDRLNRYIRAWKELKSQG
jgi:(p)ppGpp synthase/HD superfamily hydrolase